MPDKIIPIGKDKPDNLLSLDASNEDDIALKYAVMYADKLKFDHTRGKWYAWDGIRWKVEDTGLAFDWARSLCREQRVNNKQEKLASIRVAAAVEKFSQADRRFAVTHEIWNQNPWLLCTPGGTVDLKTGKITPNKPSNLITASTTVTPSAMPTPVWNKFLAEATNNDENLALFLQKIAGYCLTGITKEHALFFLYGFGGNGKGTFVNALREIMGDYAINAGMDTFTASRNDRHPTELASLQDARMVTASETEENRAWAESRIKQLTGGDPITARFMRQDEFTFMPKFKLVIQGNHAPTLHSVDDAMRRRFNVIPFIHRPKVANKDLPDQLQAEYPGILQWAITGGPEWHKGGLVKPKAVADETDHYFSEQDVFQQWLDECTEPAGPDIGEPIHRLFDSWKSFCTRMSEGIGTRKAFSQNLVKARFKRVKKVPGTGGQRGFLRISLKCDTSRPYGYDD